MNKLQQDAFNCAKQSLDPDSKFYKQDLAELRRFYARKTEEECRWVISYHRAIAAVTQEEIDLHCQFP